MESSHNSNQELNNLLHGPLQITHRSTPQDIQRMLRITLGSIRFIRQRHNIPSDQKSLPLDQPAYNTVLQRLGAKIASHDLDDATNNFDTHLLIEVMHGIYNRFCNHQLDHVDFNDAL